MNLTRFIASSIIAFGLTSCARDVPYRHVELSPSYDAEQCRKLYAAYDAAPTEGAFPAIAEDDDCWRRSREEHADYDLLFAEFDDQGWVQGASGLDLARKDYLDTFIDELESLFRSAQSQSPERGLSLVVYVHGWHHNAHPADEDVHSFRRLLRQIKAMEDGLARAGHQPMRVVGIYVGWRGESVTIPIVRKLTFWDRKNAAQRVSQGSVRELLGRLDLFRDSKRAQSDPNLRNVRMLTIGHSFGGLITFESLSAEFVRNSVRFREVRPGSRVDPFMSRVGDLVVIVNPAFEGTRYEPLRAASGRLNQVERAQLPTLIVATSVGDWATRYAFPFARFFSTQLEIERSDEQRRANVRAIGHNERYTTHRLGLGKCDEPDCSLACGTPAAAPDQKIKGSVEPTKLDAEYLFMNRMRREGVRKVEYLCNGMKLESTRRWVPERNPFWVVQTTDEIIKDHGDIFNPNFVAFLRQMYLGFIFARRDAQ